MNTKKSKGGPAAGGVWDVVGWAIVGGVLLGLTGFGWVVLQTALMVPASVLAIRIALLALGGDPGAEAA